MDLQQIYILVVFICFIVSIIYRKHHDFPIQMLSVLLLIIIFVETSGYTLRNILKINNQFLFHFYGPVEYSFIAFLYASHFKNEKIKKATNLSIPIFIIFCLVNSLYLQKITETPYNFIIRCLLITSLVLCYFYELSQSDEILFLRKMPMFWISLGNFIFYAGSFFLMGLIDKLESMKSVFVPDLFKINTFLNIFLYLMFIIAFVCKKKQI